MKGKPDPRLERGHAERTLARSTESCERPVAKDVIEDVDRGCRLGRRRIGAAAAIGVEALTQRLSAASQSS